MRSSNFQADPKIQGLATHPPKAGVWLCTPWVGTRERGCSMPHHQPPVSPALGTCVPSRSQAGPGEITFGDIPVVSSPSERFVLKLRALIDSWAFKGHALRPLKKSREMSVSESAKVYIFTTYVALLFFTPKISKLYLCFVTRCKSGLSQSDV